ncbi:hypothetical protein PENSPDRAFT_662749 [Peniophora sp. CONT]|nr:hypothetical protein PENSPDRAFT_662749 [Peniophora sp. CONT]
MFAFPLDDWLQSSRAEFESASALVLEDAIIWPDGIFTTKDESADGNNSSHAQDEVKADGSVGVPSVAECSDNPVTDTPLTSPPTRQKDRSSGAPVQPAALSRSPRVGFSRESLARINSVLSTPSQSTSRTRTASGPGLSSNAISLEKPSAIVNSSSSPSLASRLGSSINNRALPTTAKPPSTPHHRERRRKSSPRKAPHRSPRSRSTTSNKTGHWAPRFARSD